MAASSGMDLTQGSITRNLVKLSLPIMASNFMQTFYDLANAFWLGRLGEHARDAVSAAGITFPILFFLSSFGFGFVIAGTALVARYKGAREPEKIKKTIGQLIFILVVFTVVFLSFSLGYINQILRILHTPPEIFALSRGYLRIILIGAVFMFIFIFYQSISQGLGDTVTPMKAQITAVVLNVILDPVLIFGLLSVPRFETIGAAYATLIARALAASIALVSFKRRYKDLIPSMADIAPKWDLIKTILKVSIPASLSLSTTSFGFVFLQGFVNSYGTVAISINSIGGRMTNIFMMPAMGISSGLAAVVGQNLGAKNIPRAEKSIWRAFSLITPIMGIGCLLIFFFAAQLTHFFIDDPEVIEAGKRMFKLTAYASFIFGILFVFNGVFNGAGDTRTTMKLDMTRLWLIRIPLVYILSGKLLEYSFFSSGRISSFMHVVSKPLSAFPYDSLWWSMVISNLISTAWAILIFRSGRWKKIKIG